MSVSRPSSAAGVREPPTDGGWTDPHPDSIDRALSRMSLQSTKTVADHPLDNRCRFILPQTPRDQ
jgi:hypothetical protein